MSDLQAQVADAIQLWGTPIEPPRLIGIRENAVFEVKLENEVHAALRVHRAGYQTTEAIEAELHWTDILASQGFPCPRPVRTRRGAYLADADICVSLVSWIDAPCIGISGGEFPGSDEEQEKLYSQLGALLRRLHETTDAAGLPPLARASWDLDGLLGETPLWGRFWENPSLTSAESTFLNNVRQSARETLQSMKAPDIGLIHADALQENVLSREGQMWLIDFDDSGYGYRGFELGAALSQHALTDRYPALAEAILNGYQANAETRRLLPLFSLLRAFASCGWIVPRAKAEDPRQRKYADRALLLAHDWVST